MSLLNKWTQTLIEISKKELAGTQLSDSDYKFIGSFGGKLEHVWSWATGNTFNRDTQGYIEEHSSAIVADIATDPNGRVLDIAEGYPSFILVAIYDQAKDRIKLAVGGVYSYYEFLRPLSDRLTDKEWRRLLGQKDHPSMPEWVKNFVVSGKVFYEKSKLFYYSSYPFKWDRSITLTQFKQECKNHNWRYVEHYNECQHLDKLTCEKDVPACIPY